MGSPHTRRARSRLLLVALAAVVSVLTAAPAAAQTYPPAQFTPLSPANGSTVALAPGENISYRWHIDWPGGPTNGTVIVSVRTAMDPGLTQGSTNTYACPAANVNCWESFTPNVSYGPPWGRTFYWSVSVTGGGESPVYSYRTVLKPDRTPPRVRAVAGSARRGAFARFRARASDNRGAVRLRVEVRWGRHVVLRGRFPLAQVAWGRPLVFVSQRPLSRRLPAGIYRYCITAWDAAGNRRQSCARYRIR